MTGSVALTQNGNLYTKTNKAKIIGVVPGIAFSAISILGSNKTNNTMRNGFILGGASALLGLGIGAIFDKIINNKRAANADSKAVKLNVNA